MKEYNDNLEISSLALFEREYIRSSSNTIQLKCLKNHKEKLYFLLKNNYEIKEICDPYYHLSKKIEEVKSFRISLTESCNYKCFFCHEEGMEMSEKRSEKTLEEIYDLILKAIEKGFMDITFTGGEPLIKKKWVIELIDRLSALDESPDLTIVTNGVLVDDTLLDVIEKYSGNFKFNFSMHHTNKDKYLDIVLPKDGRDTNYDIVTENIQQIVARGIPVKLNFVVLNGINNSKEDLIDILDYASRHRVNGVKFLEFLVTDKLLDKYQYYFTLESVYSILRDNLSFSHENLRTKYYHYKDTDLIVELSHCTCAIGCSKCTLAKDVTVTSELKYFPCFFRSNKGYSLETDIDRGLSEGENIIRGFAQKYKNKTPFKVSNVEYFDKIVHHNYITSKSIVQNIFKSEPKRTRTFEERVYCNNLEKGIIKIYKNSYDHDYHEVVKKTSLSGNQVTTSFVFGKEKRVISDLKKYEEYLEIIDSPLKATGNWKIDYFDLGGREVSVGELQGSSDLYIVSDKPLNLDEFPGLKELHNLIEIHAYNI